jgi:hypothetical protein
MKEQTMSNCMSFEVAGRAVLCLGLWAAEAAIPQTAFTAVVEIDANGAIAIDGEPFFPIGQWLQSSSRIAEEKALGFNTFIGNGGDNTSAEYLSECKAQGVWCVMDPADMSVKDHPALLGWIFGDEPDLDGNAIEPDEILTQYQNLKASDPNHIAFLTLTAGFYSENNIPQWMGGSRDRYYEYPKATDVIGFDQYPIYGWCRPDWIYQVGAAQQELWEIYAPGKTAYQWIECAKTSSQWCEIEERGEEDGPYPEEVRNEVWQAIARGAMAIGYFTHSWECPNYAQLCLNEGLENELIRTNGQLAALTRPLLSPRYGSEVVSDAQGKVDFIGKLFENKVYLFTANHEREALTISFTVPGMPAGTAVEVYDENRSIISQGQSFADTYESLGVHIYVVDVEQDTDDSDTDTGNTDDTDTADSDTVDDIDAGDQDSGTDGAQGRSGCGCAMDSTDRIGFPTFLSLVFQSI